MTILKKNSKEYSIFKRITVSCEDNKIVLEKSYYILRRIQVSVKTDARHLLGEFKILINTFKKCLEGSTF